MSRASAPSWAVAPPDRNRWTAPAAGRDFGIRMGDPSMAPVGSVDGWWTLWGGQKSRKLTVFPSSSGGSDRVWWALDGSEACLCPHEAGECCSEACL